MNITRFKFEEEIVNERSEWGALFRSEHVRCQWSPSIALYVGSR